MYICSCIGIYIYLDKARRDDDGKVDGVRIGACEKGYTNERSAFKPLAVLGSQ